MSHLHFILFYSIPFYSILLHSILFYSIISYSILLFQVRINFSMFGDTHIWMSRSKLLIIDFLFTPRHIFTPSLPNLSLSLFFSLSLFLFLSLSLSLSLFISLSISLSLSLSLSPSLFPLSGTIFTMLCRHSIISLYAYNIYYSVALSPYIIRFPSHLIRSHLNPSLSLPFPSLPTHSY